MKKLLLLFGIIISFTACSDDEGVPVNENKNGSLSFDSYYVDKLSTGEERKTAQSLAIIHIWNADDTDFDFEKSKNDLMSGYVYDNIEGKSLKANRTYMNKWTLSEELKPGKYVIYVNYGQKVSSKQTEFSYSYTYFEIKKQEVTFLKKHLRKGQSYPYFVYHPWE